ncbi:MAG TPA: peptidoglycan-binding protein [Acidimicrobiia bacterium]|nr:peptidoglycan-binding protein [Acidimicrobiia bacterium]
MKTTRRLTFVLSLLALIATSCGDDSGGIISSTTTAAGGTTTTVADTTTTVDARPLAAFDGRLVEDPLYGSGFYEMEVAEEGTFAYSLAPVTGGTPGANLLAIATPDGVETSGLTADLVPLVAWVQQPTDDVQPTNVAVALYREGANGWEVAAALTDAAVLGFLETTTDYEAWKPHDGTFYARATVNTISWDGAAATFVADVHVLDFPANAEESFYEVQCTADGVLECVLLSDDGVLRPGDEGESVEALQLALIDIGYMSGEPSGAYDADTEAAVRRLQRDFRLTRDGKVGPNTQGVIDDIIAGEIVLASQDGIGSVDIDTNANPARTAIIELLGTPDSETGWVNGPCGPLFEWNVLSWGGFSVYLTERDGPRLFDGWRVTDLATVPGHIYFAGGIAQNWRWSNFDAMGASYDPFYQFWSHAGLGYGIGLFATSQGNPPDPNAVIEEFGTGSGNVLYDC